MKKKIIVVGTGYVGLPAALLLARAGYDVVGVDINENIVQAINDGILHIKETDLQKIMDAPQVRQNLHAQSVPCAADVFLIAVPTPIHPHKKVAELKYVHEAVESIIPYLQPGNLVILESTVPPLTCRTVITPILEKSGLTVGKDLFLAHCPERILPGDVFYEIVHNNRIIGAADQTSREMAQDIYASFVKGELSQTDDITAEICKLMENTYRDVNIALANELAEVMEGLGINPVKAIELANKHPRVNILKPGIGVGGHCIPIDPWFIKEVDPANSRLIFTSRLINEEMPHRIAAKIRRSMRDVSNPQIVAVGASYKANTVDIRESPALKIVELLAQDGYHVDHFDPLISGMEYSSLSKVCQGMDCLAILVEHNVVRDELKSCIEELRLCMRTPIILRFC
ncbi:MAG: nucleotide sugar dehydrogenase [Deltaproteobacteria bacterium]|nr:nucleotide sugar dehydrogenase [Deltaproteobacteria bacterium]